MFVVWNHMMQRCYNQKSRDYQYYGARSIKVAERWHDFKVFVDDMLPTYREGLTLDRSNNLVGYSKQNCQWITHKEQCNNRRSNHIVVDPNSGQKYTLQQLSEKFGVKYHTLQSRIARGHDRFDELIHVGHLRKYDPFQQIIRSVQD